MSAAVMALAGLVGCRATEPTEPAPPRPQAVRAVAVKHGPVRVRLRAVGTVRPAEEVQVVAQTLGRLVALPVPEGGQARRGAVLARIASPEMSAKLSRVAAELDRARIEHEHACRQLETEAKLGASGDIPRERLDQKRKACDATAAAERAAQSAFDEVQAVAARAIEVAPFEGQVLRWLVAPGQSVAPGRPLLEYGTLARELSVLLSEDDILRGVRLGTPVLVDLGAGGERRRAVTEVAAATAPNSRSLQVRIALEPEDSALLGVGMTADVSFLLAEEERAASVPKGAIRRRDGETSVLVVEGAAAREVKVETGLSERGWVSIRPALPPETLVIVGRVDAIDPRRPIYAVVDEVRR